MSIRFLNLLKVVSYVLGFCGIAGILYWSLIWNHYYDVLPHSPNPAQGRVYALNMHGVVEYATRRERNRLNTSEDASLALIGLAIVGVILTGQDYWRKMGWRYPEEPHSAPGVDPPGGHRPQPDRQEPSPKRH